MLIKSTVAARTWSCILILDHTHSPWQLLKTDTVGDDNRQVYGLLPCGPRLFTLPVHFRWICTLSVSYFALSLFVCFTLYGCCLCPVSELFVIIITQKLYIISFIIFVVQCKSCRNNNIYYYIIIVIIIVIIIIVTSYYYYYYYYTTIYDICYCYINIVVQCKSSSNNNYYNLFIIVIIIIFLSR